MICDIPHIYALRRILAIAQTSAILDSVVEVNIGSTFSGSRRVSDIPFLLYPAVLMLVKTIPAMQQLQTVHLHHVILPREYLYTILSSPHLIHLILDTIQMPKMSKFPPPKLRKLTLTAIPSWDAVEALISQLSASLEYLEIQWCEFRDLRNLQLHPFPCLRELHYHEHYEHIFADGRGFFRLGPHISHLYLSGNFYHTQVAPFPGSLRHLSVEEGVLTEKVFGTDPCPWLISLSIECVREWRGFNNRLPLLSFVCDRFPSITSLHLNMSWQLRNFAMVLARSLHNVQALTLVIDTNCDLTYEDSVSIRFGHPVEIPTEYLRRAVLPAAMQSLSLEVVQISSNLERSVVCCVQWVEDHILHCVTGLGGPHLKSIDVVFVKLKSKSKRERVLRMQWVKSFNGYWQTEKWL